VAGFCEEGNEPSGSINGGKFLDQFKEYQLFKMDSAPWSCYVVTQFGLKAPTENTCELVVEGKRAVEVLEKHPIVTLY
jgi:hypothetical protein